MTDPNAQTAQLAHGLGGRGCLELRQCEAYSDADLAQILPQRRQGFIGDDRQNFIFRFEVHQPAWN